MRATSGTLLGGRLHYDQPADGYRTGLEPVLLAACVPARPGERVLEGGTGAGAALLCLAARVPGVTGIGVELDPDMAELARRNLASNGLDSVGIVTGDLLTDAPAGPFDHALANPPWHDPAGTPPVLPRRARAKRAAAGLLDAWAAALGARLRRGGTLTLILPASHLAAGVAGLGAGGCGGVALMPLWPRVSRPAGLIVLQGVRGGRGAGRVLPGLVLHADGGFTPEAEAALRGGAALALG